MVKEAEKSLVCFHSFLFSPLKCFSMFYLHSRQGISTPAEHQLTPDSATELSTMAVDVANRRCRFKTAVSGAKRTERWDKTDPKDRDHKLGFIYFGCDFHFLKPCSWSTRTRRIAVAFLCNNRIVAARGNLFWRHSSKQGELTHTQLPACLPQEMLLGQGEELKGTKFAHIHTG